MLVCGWCWFVLLVVMLVGVVGFGCGCFEVSSDLLGLLF